MFLVPVFFRPEPVGAGQPHSPRAHEPARVVADWQRACFPIEIVEPAPATREDLCLGYEARHVDEVFAALGRDDSASDDAQLARSVLFTCGTMLDAARAAIANGRVAVAPVWGFQHAPPGFGDGHCTFDGTVVAAIRLQRHGLGQRVGILDFDHHDGGQSEGILRRFTIGRVRYRSIGREHRRPDQAQRFLDELPAMVRSFAACGLLLYQASSDPHVDDPRGGWLTTTQLAERDRIVFETARDMGLPVAWKLGGSHRRVADDGIEPTLEIHRNTMRACIAAHSDSGEKSPRRGARIIWRDPKPGETIFGGGAGIAIPVRFGPRPRRPRQ